MALHAGTQHPADGKARPPPHQTTAHHPPPPLRRPVSSSNGAAAIRAMDRVVHDLPPTLHDGAPLKIALSEQGSLVRGLHEAARARTATHASRVVSAIRQQMHREADTAAKLQARSEKVQQHVVAQRETRDSESRFRAMQYAERVRQGGERMAAAERATRLRQRDRGDAHRARHVPSCGGGGNDASGAAVAGADASSAQRHDVERRRLNDMSFRDVERQLLNALKDGTRSSHIHSPPLQPHNRTALALSSSTSPGADCLSESDLRIRCGSGDAAATMGGAPTFDVTGGANGPHHNNHQHAYRDIAAALRKAEREWTAANRTATTTTATSSNAHAAVQLPREARGGGDRLAAPQSTSDDARFERNARTQARAIASASRLDARRLEESEYRRALRDHREAHATKVQARVDALREQRSSQLEQHVADKKHPVVLVSNHREGQPRCDGGDGAETFHGSKVWATVAVHRTRAAALDRQRTAARERLAAAAGERFVNQMFHLQQ